MVKFKQVGAWLEAHELLKNLPKALPKAVEQAIRQEAELLRSTIIKKIRSGPFAPLSPRTLAVYKFIGRKHGGKPLNGRGDLAGGVKVIPKGKSFFIGIPAGVKGKDGQEIVRIGLVHEEGRTIVMKYTPKMAAFLHAAFRAAGLPEPSKSSGAAKTGILVIQIPARPFMKPSFDEWSHGLHDRLEQRVIKLLEKASG